MNGAERKLGHVSLLKRDDAKKVAQKAYDQWSRNDLIVARGLFTSE